MMYLIFPDGISCQNRNNEIAISQGCGGTGNVTQYWFQTVTHPTNGEWAMQVNDQSLLTITEQSQLVNQEYMDLNNWFQNSNTNP